METQIHATQHRSRAFACALGLAVAVAGCGDNSARVSEPRPAVPIVVNAAITTDGIAVSPRSFGSGPIRLVVSNQTGASQEVVLQSARGDALRQRTGPINPRSTASLQADLAEDTAYTVAVAGAGGEIRPARLTVGTPRPSAQQDLLQP